MKKTTTVSIGGIVFHIEEDAYEKLHRYLEAIKSHFRGFEGKEEVISDIESRIAEILQNKISPNKEVIIIDDIDEIIGILGQPADFVMNGEEPSTEPGATYYRPYKRLYRDPDNRTIAGVCTGIGAYFSIDPMWVKIIFLVSILISGTGLLVYLILWLVVPEARTTAEKLEMRGEPVNLSTLEQSLGDEMGHFKEKFNDLTSRAKTSYQRGRENFRTRHQPRVMDGLGEVGKVLLRIVVIFIGIIILFTGIALTVAYLSILFKFPVVMAMDNAGIHAFPLYSIIERVFTNDGDIRTFVTGMMIIIGIPLLMMLWAGIRMIFGLPRAKVVAGAAGIVWICALIITLIFGFKVANSFRTTGEVTHKYNLNITKIDTLHLIANRFLPDNFRWEHSGVFYFPEMRMAFTDDAELMHGVPLIKVRPSEDSTAHLLVITSARGASLNDARETADRINYIWEQRGDTLILQDNFSLDQQDKWRKQEARVEVQVPKGTVMTIDKKLQPFMGYHKNVSFNDRIGTLYIMNNDGLVRN